MPRLSPRMPILAIATAFMASCSSPGAGADVDMHPVDEFVAEFASMSLEDQTRVVGGVREVLDRALLTPAPEVLERNQDLVNTSGVHIVRLLNRGDFTGLTTMRGGGAFYSFSTLSHDYNKRPDIELQNGRLTSGFYGGNDGVFVSLDSTSLAKVKLEDVPESVRLAEPDHIRGNSPEVPPVGGVIALRSVLDEESDTLVALQILDVQESEITFAWKMLHNYGIPGSVDQHHPLSR